MGFCMGLNGFLTALAGNLKEKEIELYRRLTDGVDIKSFDTPEQFFYAVTYPWEKFTRGCLAINLDNDDAEFLYAHFDFINAHLSRLFVDFEGSGCSVDKSSHIINQLAKHSATGDLIEFDYTDEKAYWLPRKILRNHDSVLAFYNSLHCLYQGNPSPYLKELRSIASVGKER